MFSIVVQLTIHTTSLLVDLCRATFDDWRINVHNCLCWRPLISHCMQLLRFPQALICVTACTITCKEFIIIRRCIACYSMTVFLTCSSHVIARSTKIKKTAWPVIRQVFSLFASGSVTQRMNRASTTTISGDLTWRKLDIPWHASRCVRYSVVIESPANSWTSS